MRILYVASVFPYPPISGHRIRNYNLLRRIGEKHELHLHLIVEKLPPPEHLNALEPISKSIQCYVQESLGALDRPLLGVRFLLRGMPPDFRACYNRTLFEALQNQLLNDPVDVFQVEDPQMAQYVEAVPNGSGAKKVLTFHDINFRKFRRISKLETRWKRRLRLWLHSALLNRWEPKYASNFDLCVVMSEIDRDLLMSRNQDLNVITVPNGVDTKEFPLQISDAPLYNLVFVGNMDYRPNVEAVAYFCREVMPNLISELPDLKFYVVGINPQDEVLALANEHVIVTGHVESVIPFYEKSGVCVVPLHAGGGTRLKILESLALGCPVVSTRVGAEGLDLVDGEHLLIANDTPAFVEKILALLHNVELRRHLIVKGREQVVKCYDWDAIAERLLNAYQRLARGTNSASGLQKRSER